MTDTSNLIGQLEHDHHHLDRLVDDVRDAVQAVLRGEKEPAEIRGEVEEFLSVADEDVYEHFDREEQALFPFVRERMPDATPRVRALEFAHDRMCGILARAERVVGADEVEFTAGFDDFIAIFARFEATYTRHSQDEMRLIQDLRAHLTGPDLEQLGELLKDL